LPTAAEGEECGMRAKNFRLIVGLLASTFGASFPAWGQLYPYPVIIVPPPAQNQAVPKPKPAVPKAPPGPAGPAPDAPEQGHELQCRLQGQTRVCD
jgi:hypothetical protein